MKMKCNRIRVSIRRCAFCSIHDSKNKIYISDVLNTSQSFLSIGHLFRSTAGISLVAETLHQIAVVRYALCRNLLILQQILIDTSDLPIETIEFIRSDCMPETVVFVQAYYVMVWICETYENQPTSGTWYINCISNPFPQTFHF